MYLTNQFYNEDGNKVTGSFKMERNATKGYNSYEPGLQVVLDDVAGFRVAAQAMHNHHTDQSKVANLQLSAYNDDMWLGFNVKNNFGKRYPFAAEGKQPAEEGDQAALEQALVGMYYKANKDLQVHARGDLVNHFVSAGCTHKHKLLTLTAEGFWGLAGKAWKTNKDVDHEGINGANYWMRMGVDMPLSKDTSLSWNGHFAKNIMSQMDFKQKMNNNMAVAFTNKYSSGNATPVDVGVQFTYTK